MKEYTQTKIFLFFMLLLLLGCMIACLTGCATPERKSYRAEEWTIMKPYPINSQSEPTESELLEIEKVKRKAEFMRKSNFH